MDEGNHAFGKQPNARLLRLWPKYAAGRAIPRQRGSDGEPARLMHAAIWLQGALDRAGPSCNWPGSGGFRFLMTSMWAPDYLDFGLDRLRLQTPVAASS